MKTAFQRKLIWLIITIVLAVCCGAAMASPGDRTLQMLDTQDGMMNTYIENALPWGDGFCLFMRGSEQQVLVYADAAAEPETYLLQDESETQTGLVPDGEESVSVQNVAWFTWNGDIYVIQAKTIYRSESSELEGAHLKRLVLADGQAMLEDTELPDPDWTNMIEEWGEYQSSRWVNKTIVFGERVAMSTYDGNGQNVLEIYDMTTGYLQEMDLPESPDIYPGPDGKMLFLRYDWGADEALAKISLFDIESESEEEIASIPVSDGNMQALCWDEKNSTLYYVAGGEIWSAPEMNIEEAVSVNDCPVQYGANALPLSGGYLMLWSNNEATIRNTDPAVRSAYKLTIQDYAYTESMMSTIYDFTNRHGDFSVVLHRGGNASQILQAMLNRDAQTDIYTLAYESSDFEALRNRGFLADLSGNSEIAGAVAQMYPFAQKSLTKDGKIVAVPASISGNTLGYRKDILTRIGMTPEELPKTWNEFFDWLGEMPQRLEGKDIVLFDTWMNRESIRSSFFYIILNQYQAYLENGEQEYAFSTPLLLGLLKRLDEVDYDALGIAETTEDDEVVMNMEYKEPLLEMYGQVTMTGWSGEAGPLAMSMEAGAEPVLPVTMYVAFVNPYSEHAEEAAEYLALSMDHLQTVTQYSIFSDRTEPVRYPDFEETKEYLKQWYEDAKAMLEKMDEDDENYSEMKEAADSYEQSLADFDNTYWMISPDSITAYQERLAWIQVLGYDFVNSLVSETDTSFYDMVSSYARGQISPEELLSSIDKKVQMMRLEGN